MPGRVVITGASRGIGLEFCRQYVEDGWEVVACSRSASRDLESLERAGSVRCVRMDVADPASIRSAAASITDGGPLDLLINNAGVYPHDPTVAEGPDRAALVEAFVTNAVAPLEVVHAVLPALRRGGGKRIVHLTSLMGSIDDNGSGGSYAYRMSKAALNMAVRNLGHELGREGFVTVALHPGWVRTAMGGAGAPSEVGEAVSEMRATIERLTPRDNGAFLDADGSTLPW